LWTATEPSYQGQFCQFDGIGFLPTPVQDPLPVWVGGQSRVAARRAARYGQCWHATRTTPDHIASLLPWLRACLDAEGRDPQGILVSLKRRLHFTDLGLDPGSGPFTPDEVVGTADDVLADARRCRDLGIGQLTYDFRTADPDQQIAIIERLANHVVAAFRS
jgi:hypothetical protein